MLDVGERAVAVADAGVKCSVGTVVQRYIGLAVSVWITGLDVVIARVPEQRLEAERAIAFAKTDTGSGCLVVVRNEVSLAVTIEIAGPENVVAGSE